MFRQIFAPPIFEDDEKSRIAALLNAILWAVILIGTIYTIIAPIILGQYVSAVLTASIVIVSLVARQLMIRSYIRAAAIILLTIFNIVLAISIAVSDGVFGASYFSLVMTVVIAGILLGGRSAYVVAAVNTLIGLGIMLAQDTLPEPMIPQNPVTFFSSLIVYVFFIAALFQASSRGLGSLLENLRNAQEELTKKNRELQNISANLEDIVKFRTLELDAANQRNERRAKQFEAIAQVSRVINQTREIDSLLPQITQVISQQFGFYHVGIFLMDANSEYAVLIASNSSGGQRMLARNHKLKVGQTGIVGYVAGTGLPRIALDTGADAIFFNNPDLPDTRSEIALPLLRQGREIMGILDVQSREPNAFNQEDVRILSTLADQVAIAIENARLFEQTQSAIQEAESFYRKDLKEGWSRFARSQQISGIQRRNLKTNILSEPVEIPGAFEAIRSGRAYKRIETNAASLITVPMKLRGEVVGVLNIKAGSDRNWNEDEMDIINAIVERAALSIENARLLEESRKVAEREHAIGEISTKISAGTEIETILRTAVRELGARISGAQVTVEIGGGEI